MIPINIFGEDKFKIVDSWNHDHNFLGRIFFSIIDNDSHVIGTFYKIGNRLITKGSVSELAPRGQGPNELINIMALFQYKTDIAFVEGPDRIKIFEKKNDTYIYKRSIWLKRTRLFQTIKNGLYIQSKWFIAGFEHLNINEKKQKISLLKVYDAEGNILKNLMIQEYKKQNRYYMMDQFVLGKAEKVFFLSENELKVNLISAKTLEQITEVSLEIPAYYTPMPKEFYIHNTAYKSPNDFLRDEEHWKSSYSRITKAIIEGDYLVVQIRTCQEKLKIFALLFYSLNTFNLEKTILIDDLLLGAHESKYYFHANGGPGFEIDADKSIIHIYQFNKN